MSAAPIQVTGSWLRRTPATHAEKKARAEQLAEGYAAYPNLRTGLHEGGFDCLCIASILIEHGIPLPKQLVGDCIALIHRHDERHRENGTMSKHPQKGRDYE